MNLELFKQQVASIIDRCLSDFDLENGEVTSGYTSGIIDQRYNIDIDIQIYAQWQTRRSYDMPDEATNKIVRLKDLSYEIYDSMCQELNIPTDWHNWINDYIENSIEQWKH